MSAYGREQEASLYTREKLCTFDEDISNSEFNIGSRLAFGLN